MQTEARDFYRKIHQPAISVRVQKEKDLREAAESLALFSSSQLAVTKFWNI